MGLTEEEIAAILRRSFDAFNRGDFQGATALSHPEIELFRTWEQTPLRGPTAMRDWMQPDAFTEQHAELTEIVSCTGNSALARQSFSAKGAGSGIDFGIVSWGVWSFDDDGLVTRIEFFLDHEGEKAREAAELAAG